MNYDAFGNENDSLYQTIRPFLREGEQLLWSGVPYASRHYRPQLFPAMFILVWLGFVLFLTFNIVFTEGIMILLMLPFLLVGFGFGYWIFFGEQKRYRRMVYAVTDSRAIILEKKHGGTTCREYIFSNLSTVSMSELRGTSGSIDFAPDAVYEYARRRNSFATKTDCFRMIDDVQTVYRMISDQIASGARKK